MFLFLHIVGLSLLWLLLWLLVLWLLFSVAVRVLLSLLAPLFVIPNQLLLVLAVGDEFGVHSFVQFLIRQLRLGHTEFVHIRRQTLFGAHGRLHNAHPRLLPALRFARRHLNIVVVSAVLFQRVRQQTRVLRWRSR